MYEPLTVSGKLLEVEKGEFKGNAWAKIKLRSKDVLENKILVYKVDGKRVDISSLDGFLDTEVEVALVIALGDKDFAILKVAGIR